MDADLICQHYLKGLYEALDAYSFAETYQSHDLATTQGEILYPSLNKLMNAAALKTDDIFYDLGSGSGKVTAQVFLNSVVGQACGIELIPELHQHSVKVARQIQADLPEFFAADRQLNFIGGNFLEADFSSATAVLINSTCFGQQLLRELTAQINRQEKIRVLMSLRPLPGLQHLKFTKTIPTECTWDTVLCYLYQKQ